MFSYLDLLLRIELDRNVKPDLDNELLSTRMWRALKVSLQVSSSGTVPPTLGVAVDKDTLVAFL